MASIETPTMLLPRLITGFKLDSPPITDLVAEPLVYV